MEIQKHIAPARRGIEDAVNRVNQLHQGLSKLLDAVVEEGAASSALTDLYVLVREAKERLAEATQMIGGLHDSLKFKHLPEALDREDTTSKTTESGYRITLTEVVRASIKSDRRPSAYSWLRENDLGDLIQETVNASTLAAFAKNYMREHGKDLPDNLFTVHVQPQVSLTKVR